jgi:hypothetical protein
MSEPIAPTGPATAPDQQAYRDLKKRFKLPRAVRRPALWVACVAGAGVVGYELWIALAALAGGGA